MFSRNASTAPIASRWEPNGHFVPSRPQQVRLNIRAYAPHVGVRSEGAK